MTTSTYPAAKDETACGESVSGNRRKAEVFLVYLSTYRSEPYGTSGHLGFSAEWSLIQHLSTSWVVGGAPTPRIVAEEVRELRDRIIGTTGLSRQEVARAIGVDRRSLSGYVSGEIRPTDDRIQSLRDFAEIAEWSVDRFGEHARELLRGGSSGRPLLDLFREQGVDIRRTLEASGHARRGARASTIKIEDRPTRPSLHIHAQSVWAEESRLPEPGGTPRETSTYEQDLGAAPQVPDPQGRPRRRQI